MAQENVKAFYEKLMESDELKAKLKTAEEAYTGDKDDIAKAVEEIIIPLAKEAGLPFTIEELKAAEEAMRAESELTEDELSAVAGGKGGCFIFGGGKKSFCIGVGVRGSLRHSNDGNEEKGACVIVGVFTD